MLEWLRDLNETEFYAVMVPVTIFANLLVIWSIQEFARRQEESSDE